MHHDFLVGTTPTQLVKGVYDINGPHIDNDGNPFDPCVLDMLSPSGIFERSHSTDLFFTCYTLPGMPQWPRMHKNAVKSITELIGEPVMHMFAFDWDTPNHAPWNDDLLEDFISRFDALTNPLLKAWGVLYTSRHGARLVYFLKDPVTVRDGEQYIATLLLLFKEQGLEMDSSCKDWTRLFRAPRVVRNGLRTEEEPYFIYEEQSGTLDTSKLKKSPTLTIPSLKSFDAGRYGQPGPEEVDDYIHTTNDSGNRVQSAFFKDARTAFKHVPCFHALFKPDVTIAQDGERNDVLMKSLGAAIPITVRKIPYATPEHIFSLYYGPVSALEQDINWSDWLWNAIMSIWPQEVEKYNEDKKKQSDRAAEALSDKDRMVEGMRTWCNHPDLQDDDKAGDFVERHLFANHANVFYALNTDGTYSPMRILQNQLIPRIRTTFMGNIVDTQEVGGNGRLIDVSDKRIQNAHSTVVSDVQMVVQMNTDGQVEDMDGEYPVLKMPMYRRNPNLEPEYSEAVDTWLSLLLGLDYDLGCLWIANALAFEDGPICALSITAAPGVGKQLLITGLSECLERPMTATARSLVSTDNGMLMRTPFLYVNEEWPKNMKGSTLEILKNYTAGDAFPVEEKFKPILNVSNPLRIIMTANNHDMIRSVLDKDMSPDDREAIGQRILHMDLNNEAALWLVSKGGRAYTGARGNRWIAGTDGKSDFIIAKHFLWLWENRDATMVGSRFLVDGNMSGGSQFMSDQIMSKESTAKVAAAIFSQVESSQRLKNCKVMEDGALFITISSIIDGLKLNDQYMSFGDVSRVLRNLTVTQDPIQIDYQDYHELRVDMLLTHAQQAGVNTPELRKIAKLQLDNKK